MSKFHVNIDTGEYGRCSAASNDSCPFGESAIHVGDKEEAIYESEKILGEQLGLFKKEKKVVLPAVNGSYSFPQADRLDRLAETVDAIKLGSNTSNKLSESINTVSRQALYYADAAGYLGLVEHSNSKSGKQYSLTKSGESFASGSAEDRDKILRHAIAEIPAVKVFQEKGERAARSYLSENEGTGGETVERRMTTIKGWAAKLRHNEKMVSYETDLSENGESSKKSQEILGNVCQNCFTTKSLTGVCDNCD